MWCLWFAIYKCSSECIKKLGADLSSGELDPTVKFEDVGHPVYAFLDTPHAIKNIRNSWESDGTYYTCKGEAIKWDYVVQLYNVQSTLRLID